MGDGSGGRELVGVGSGLLDSEPLDAGAEGVGELLGPGLPLSAGEALGDATALADGTPLDVGTVTYSMAERSTTVGFPLNQGAGSVNWPLTITSK